MDTNMGRALADQTPTLSNSQLKNGSRIKKGLEILERHADDMSGDIHDNMLFVADFEGTISKMSEEEVVELSQLGWSESEGSWVYVT